VVRKLRNRPAELLSDAEVKGLVQSTEKAAWAERFDRFGWVEVFGILRFAQDDGQNSQRPEQARQEQAQQEQATTAAGKDMRWM
jgi:hypothetical protein